MEKKILDVCCGSRMFWFDKDHPLAIYNDIRRETYIQCDSRTRNIDPDVMHDFRELPYADNSFKLVIFDPPHRTDLGKTSWMAQNYGVLLPSWETDIKKGFDECMRVLDEFGVLIFKWNEKEIPVKKIIEIVRRDPIVGHPTRHAKTIWLTFMKY